MPEVQKLSWKFIVFYSIIVLGIAFGLPKIIKNRKTATVQILEDEVLVRKVGAAKVILADNDDFQVVYYEE